MYRLRLGLLVAFASSALWTISSKAAPLPPQGDDVIAFSVAADSQDQAAAEAFFLRNIKFMAAGYKAVAEISLTNAKAKPLLGSGWSSPGPNNSLGLKTGAVGEIRCRIPYEVKGLVLEYECPENVSQPVIMRVNGSRAELWPIRQTYECCVFLQRSLGPVSISRVPPAYNFWAVGEVAPGPKSHGLVKMEIALTNGNDPISCGEYRLHVYAEKYPDDEQWPNVSCYIRLDGLDLTRFDGFVASVMAPFGTHGYSSLGDRDNYSWGGGGSRAEPFTWTRWAVPFETCRASDTAMGDGVLKLSQLTRLHVGIGAPSNSLSEEFLLGTPQFYAGNPPAGIKVEGVDSRYGSPTPMEELAPTPLERRKAMFLNGVGIESIAISGDTLWLGTDAGLVRTSRSKPDTLVGRWSIPEGLLDDDIHAVYPDGNDVWVGTTNGVSRFNGKSFQNFTAQNGLLPGSAMAFTSTSDSVWIGMTRGLVKYDRKSKQMVPFKRSGGWAPESTGGQGVPINEGRGVYADTLAVDDQDGSLWHGAAGIGRTDGSGQLMDSQHGSTSRAIGIYPQGDNLWYLDAGGACLQRKTGEILKRFSVGRPVGSGATYRPRLITATAKDPQGNVLWVAYNDGVGFFNPTEGLFYWSPAFSVALGGLVPQTLAADDQKLWVGTDNGLMVFDKTKATYPWTQINYECPADIRACGVKLGETFGTGEDRSWQLVSIDPDPPNGGGRSALRVDFGLGKDECSKVSLNHALNLDVTGTAGVSLWAMSDRPRQFFIDVKRSTDLTGKSKSVKCETWRQIIEVGPRWQQYRIPYAAMQRITKDDVIPNNTAYLTGIEIHRCVKDFRCPGDAGKLWVSQLGWVFETQARAW